MSIDTEAFSRKLRSRSIIESEKKLLIARLSESDQEKDITTPTNCNGFGRVRHFRFHIEANWSKDPLPIYPASKALNIEPTDIMTAQVFQNAACNWRCWYCFVDFDRLSANRKVSEYFTAQELIDMYLEIDPMSRPRIIDLSGGQPDIIPEWVIWTIEALKSRSLSNQVFLWSDDNLSSYYYWNYLNEQQRRQIAEYPMYARVGCFKGYDEESFSFNTLAHPDLFHQQFDIYRQLLLEGLDMYAYVTFTAKPSKNVDTSMRSFVDRLQRIHHNLPLRTVPLKVMVFTPTKSRVKTDHEMALEFQYDVHNAWMNEISRRFTQSEIAKPITEIEMTLR